MRATALTMTLCLLVAGARGAREVPATVVRGDIVKDLEMSGTVSIGRYEEFTLAPRQWRGKWVLHDALEAGSAVAEGDVVLRFVSDDLARAVEDSQRELEWARREHAISAARRDLKVDASREALERIEHALKGARRSLGAFRDVALVNSRRRAELDEASSQFGLENARSELAQLLQMYEEDELLDATEEIVLDRARWDVANREARLELWLKQRSYAIEFEEQVQLESLGREVERLEREVGRAHREAELGDAVRSIEAEKADHAMEEKARRHAELEADLAAMTVRSPASGILLHGPVEGALDRRFTPGTQPDLTVPLATVAVPGAFSAVFDVPEAHALQLQTGLEVRVEPQATGAAAAAGRIALVSALPSKGLFRVGVEVEGNLAPALLGTACKGRASVVAARNALVIPLAVVEREDKKTWVWVSAGDRTPPRRVEVRLGVDDGTDVEVREGLAEGDVLVPPEKGR